MSGLSSLCAPALLYLAFSSTQIVIDTFRGLYNTAFLKVFVTFIFTVALNFLCQRGLSVVSWFVVFIPFIMMTIITSLLLFAFGLTPSEGTLDYSVEYPRGAAIGPN
tara:strand:- start:225 stop:545 length:321 start_codon:yes stop_codon:yes gene_type:complete